MANISISVPVGAARSILRSMGSDPTECTADDAFLVLSDLRYTEPDSLASQWFESSTEPQQRTFCRHWSAWKREYRRRNAL